MKPASFVVAIALPLFAAVALAILPEAGHGASAAPEAAAEPARQTPPRQEEAAPDPGPAFDERALAPHFGKGDLRLARARFEAGHYAEALQLFTRADDGSPQTAYMRGLAALQLDRPAEAAKLFGPLPDRLPALADRIRWNLGLARERAGDLRGAAAAWAAIPRGSARHDEAQLSRARALARAGERDDALAVLEPLRKLAPPAWGNDFGAAALLLAGEIHLQRGEKEAAAAAWLQLWGEHPLASQAEDARQRADRLGGKGPTLAQRVARAQGFLGAHQNREGTDQIIALLPHLKLPDPLACEARFALGRGHRKMREHSRAIPILEAVVAQCGDPGVRARALYILGQSTTIVAPERAVRVYETLAADYPQHSFADDALLFLAELHERAGDGEAARAALQRLVDEYPRGDYRPDALFRLYWIDRKAGEERRGLASLRVLERDYGGAADALPLERSLYWQGRSLVALGRGLEAGATWEKLIREHPAGYYSMLARGRLELLDPARAAVAEAGLPHPEGEPVVLELRTGALAGDPHYLAALELIRLGFPATAADELLRIDRKAARERAGGSHEPVLLIAALLERVESRRAAHHIAKTELRELLRGRPTGLSAGHFRIAYPLAYRDLIERHAGSFGVPADLMQALMREESSLDPQIVSWAGAIGLTQLMPSTARAVAKQLKLASPSNAALRDPDLNVRLGTAYLGQLLKQWKGNPALAAASYNAGPGAVSRWMRDRGELELDEFVEEIPIEETRNYVKRVLDSFTTYRLTYGSGTDRFLALVPARADGRALQSGQKQR